VEIKQHHRFPMFEDRTSPNAWRAKERRMGTTIGRSCVGLAVVLAASAVSAQTLEDGHERFAAAFEARLADALDRSVNLAAERALALLEAREAARAGESGDEAAGSPRGVVEQQLVAARVLEPPDGRLDGRAVPAGVFRTDEPEPKPSSFVGSAEARPLDAPRKEVILPPLKPTTSRVADVAAGGFGADEWGFPLDVPN